MVLQFGTVQKPRRQRLMARHRQQTKPASRSHTVLRYNSSVGQEGYAILRLCSDAPAGKAVKRAFMNVRTILLIAAVAVSLTPAGLAVNYDDWISQGYRWVTTDGPFACVSKDDLRLITKDRSDELELKMIEQVRAYYLIRGTMVQVISEDTSSGLSQIIMAGMTTNLWTLTKFLTKHPLKDIIGRIETPTTLGPTPTPTTSATPSESPTPSQ